VLSVGRYHEWKAREDVYPYLRIQLTGIWNASNRSHEMVLGGLGLLYIYESNDGGDLFC
jgi:hypothetical protein